ncbi:heme lyase CcmF/NrfE family subunit [Pararhodospirillum oryzae]|uniref:Cytochrome c biogenesis protein CcmF n=1 Tax=Pararhodospirillum oryzae TaxID=478448 RepID=A0A512H6H6_9PROT|nr:heme lyase CcmF/NrfE family subunit [Pararhodospirillum oryzae]GEO81044.1 cytochrome c biogenesis protein CcmF [Pararhodospirillum oryzae]
MIAEFGHFCLILALCVAVVQSTVPMIGAQRNNLAWMETANTASVALFALIALAFGALTYAFVVSDFSVINVIENSHTDKPMLYKVSGVWGNHEGSLLLWILILAGFSLAVSWLGSNLPPALRARALAVQAMIIVGFLLFILLTSNPFARVAPELAPPNGQGMNPLLQDPGLAFHPPMLYAGYVGFSMAFSFAIAALIEGRVDAAWARWVRPWTLAAWVFLTLGIALGSWWAYYELGWGGWWYWDPVENASFIPWLAGTALLHSAVVVEKRDSLKAWTVLLAIVTFSLSLIGTFLVRSGVITSVHAFATDPTRGLFILLLLAVTIGGSFTLFAMRAPALQGGGLFAPVSREGSLLVNNLLMTTASATVLLGTVYPLIADALGLGKVTVGAPFFNTVFIPLMVPVVVLMVVAPLMTWKRSDLAGAFTRLRFALGVAVAVLVLTFTMNGGGVHAVGVAGGMALGAWLVIGALADLAERVRLGREPWRETWRRLRLQPRRSWGLVLGHLGTGLIVIGITGNSAWKQESVQALKPGESRTVAGMTFTLVDVALEDGPNYKSILGTVRLSQGDREVAVVHPERRAYATPPMPTTESAIHTNGISDYHAVIGEPTGDGGFVTRFYYQPAVPFLWYGALCMAVGGLISLTDRRSRVGAPRRTRLAGASASPAAEPAA